MSKLVKAFDGRRAMALAVAAAAAALLAGCSSDVSSFGNPFHESARFGSDPTPTGTLAPPAPVGQLAPIGNGEPVRPYASQTYAAPAYASQAPVGSVSSAPLEPVRPAAAPNYSSNASANSWRSAAPSAPAYARADSSPGLSHGGAVVKTEHGVWAADGGTPIVVHGGENAATLAARYNVPLEVLIRVNGFVSAAQMRPGARIVIPVYSASNGGAGPAHAAEIDRRPVDRAPPRRREADATPRESYHFVKGPDSAAARRAEEKALHAKMAKDADARGRLRSARADETDRRDAVAPPRRQAQTLDRGSRLAEAKPAPDRKNATQMRSAMVAPAAPRTSLDKTSTGSLPPDRAVASAQPDFRWPAHGRVIAGFRPGANDGINIAVPDGTAVKAVDDGVVAYAGNELKGYGNLVLIRHSNGFVSAYADNGELNVKRGETVHRGQIIARSGQSGNVSSPQLHFELRKGQTPVDPMHYLAGL